MRDRQRSIDDSQVNCEQTQLDFNFHNDEARAQADSLLDSLNPAFPRNNGRQLTDPNNGCPVVVPMPRHYLDIRSQQRIKSLDDKDDLTLPEFVQGFSKQILSNDISDPKVKAMVLHLAQLGEDLTTYSWDHMKSWSNTVIYNIGCGRYSWRDKREIESERYRTAIFVGSKVNMEPSQNVCPLFNKGQCSYSKTHGEGFIHACSYCWLTWNVQNMHPIGLCKKRLGNNNQNNFQRQAHAHSPSGNHSNRGQYRRQFYSNNHQNRKGNESKNE